MTLHCRLDATAAAIIPAAPAPITTIRGAREVGDTVIFEDEKDETRRDRVTQSIEQA
ncbi:hypothetical protein RRSWK_01315 [Rhodopirellula sp. SWK7]|nr:hypothetical protein RRSWK_01315 [Rhodopirellula sp. SWK7]